MRILITGGAGFIGSNLVDHFLKKGIQINVLDNLSTGHEKNIRQHFDKKDFTFINGDIRDLKTCKQAVKDCSGILHQAALGSVPRSLNDPLTTNEVNVNGFLNMLIAARDERIKRFVYAASSSTYGDSEKLPKQEDIIGKPLSPYAVTKYVDELYAEVFSRTWHMECIGLRYFNVFGRRQDPNGPYAAVIPLWVKAFLNHESPAINGDGSYSRDFTYIENVIQANEKALSIPGKVILSNIDAWKTKISKNENRFNEKKSIEPKLEEIRTSVFQQNERLNFHEVLNIAYGENTSLIQLFEVLRENLAKFDSFIKTIEPIFKNFREGDIPHSLASIEKAKAVIGYNPKFNARQGFEKVSEWYFKSKILNQPFNTIPTG